MMRLLIDRGKSLNTVSSLSREAAVRGDQSGVGHTGSDRYPPHILQASQNPQTQHNLWYSEKRTSENNKTLCLTLSR